MPFISLDLESIDLEDAHYVIDFFRAESISQSQPAAYVSDHIFFHFLPVRLMALLLHMIHHGLKKKKNKNKNEVEEDTGTHYLLFSPIV